MVVEINSEGIYNSECFHDITKDEEKSLPSRLLAKWKHWSQVSERQVECVGRLGIDGNAV